MASTGRQIPPPPSPCPVVYIDAAAETERLLRLLADDDSPGDFTDGISPTPFDKEDVALLSFLLRRDYTEFNTYEISSFSPADEVIPFFQVVSSRATYGPLEMGRGELCAAYLVWRLRRLSRGSIVLLEEPEAHLASHSQHVLAQALARYASALDLAIVASSHSPGFFLQLPRGAVVLVTTNGRLDVRGELWGNQLADYFGVPGSATLMAVTEDRFAASMVRALLAHLDPDLAAQLSIWHTKNGESAVRKVADELQAPRVPGRDRLIVILDGDTRLGTEPAGHYLPGTSAPEIVTLEILKNWHRDRTWIPDLPGSSDALSLALDRVLGMDHHDALEHLAATFGGLDTLMTGLIPGLLADEDFAKDAVELVANLRASAGLV
jgi:hypothetical protein